MTRPKLDPPTSFHQLKRRLEPFVDLLDRAGAIEASDTVSYALRVSTSMSRLIAQAEEVILDLRADDLEEIANEIQSCVHGDHPEVDYDGYGNEFEVKV